MRQWRAGVSNHKRGAVASKTYISGEDKKRKSQGVKAARKEKGLLWGESEQPRTKAEKAKAQGRLQRELFRTMGKEQISAFRAAQHAVDSEFLMRFVASELIELKRRIAVGDEVSTYRTDAAMVRLVDQLRRLDAIGHTDDQLVPDRVTITFGRPDDAPIADVSDIPEYE